MEESRQDIVEDFNSSSVLEPEAPIDVENLDWENHVEASTVAEKPCSFRELLVKLDVEDRDVSSRRFAFFRPLGEKPLGHIHPMSKSSVNLSATCKRHKNCSCWLTPKGYEVSEDNVLRDLVTWLASADRLDASTHGDASVDLRIKYGHRPKNQ